MGEKTKKEKEVDELLKKAEKVSNSPKKKGGEKQIARVPKKEIKQRLKTKTPGKKEDKLDLILKNQELFSKDMREEKVARQDLKKIVDSLVDRQNNTENFLNTIVTKPAGNPEKEDTKAEPTPEELAKMTDEEKQKLLEQGKEQGKKTGGQDNQKSIINPQSAFLLTETMKYLSPVVQAALVRGGGRDGKTDYATEMIRQAKTWGEIGNAYISSFLSLFKLVKPEERETAISNILHSPPSPQTKLPPSEIIE